MFKYNRDSFLPTDKRIPLNEIRDEEISGVFQCGKCKSWKTRHSEAQTRSADEPMTVFVRCFGCGAHWKQ